MKKAIIFLGVLVLLYIGTPFLVTNYPLDLKRAARFATKNAAPRSKTCCAWYVMRALQEGGCPISIYPAWAYEYVLPLHGFKEVSKKDYSPKTGDIVVIERSKKHIWGHIAIFNGKIWVSDFKQRSMNVYKRTYPYKIYRPAHYALNPLKHSLIPGHHAPYTVFTVRFYEKKD